MRPGKSSKATSTVTQHPVHLGNPGQVPRTVEREVGDHHHPLPGDRQHFGVLDDDGPLQPGRDLVCLVAVVVRVVPVSARTRVCGQPVLTVETVARGDTDERVVAVADRGDVQPMDVQVRRVGQSAPQAAPAHRPHPQCPVASGSAAGRRPTSLESSSGQTELLEPPDQSSPLGGRDDQVSQRQEFRRCAFNDDCSARQAEHLGA